MRPAHAGLLKCNSHTMTSVDYVAMKRAATKTAAAHELRSATSKAWNERPLVRSLLRSLWQPTQYCLTNAFWSATDIVAPAAACDTAGWTD